MKVSAIICEYNPLHNGHVHHIKETRKNGATHIICVLSGSFVQRGDAALLNKFDRARLAVRAGADLVLELPCVYSCASAEEYARGAVALLNALGIVDELSFGSLDGDIEIIRLLTEASVSTTELYGKRIQEQMRQGASYPAAVWEIVRQRYGNQVAEKMHDPNNLLAIEYMKAMQREQVSFAPFTIPRRYVMHDSGQTRETFASASFLRKSIAEGDRSYTAFMPDYAAALLQKRMQEGRIASMKRLERAVLFRMRTVTKEELLTLPDVSASLADRFLAAQNENTLEGFFDHVKTRCYTMARIRRTAVCAMLGIRREMTGLRPPYARVLAFSDRGAEMLAPAQKKSSIPIHTSLAKLRETGVDAETFVTLEARASHVYGLAQETVSSAEEDFRARITREVQK